MTKYEIIEKIIKRVYGYRYVIDKDNSNHFYLIDRNENIYYSDLSLNDIIVFLELNRYM